MNRGEGNSKMNRELYAAISAFILALESQAVFGDPEYRWQENKGRGEEVVNFIQEAAKALKYKVGGGASGSGGKKPDVDFSKWEK